MSRSRWIAVYAAAWVPAALVFSLALLLTDRVSASAALYAGFLTAIPGALLGIGVVAITRRLRWGDSPAWRLVFMHAAAAVAYGLIWTGSIVAQIWLASSDEGVDGFLRFGAAWQVAFGVFTYGVIAAITYTRTAIRRQQDQQRATERAETLRLKAELDALRARLEPHFLFNVLQTIGALVTAQPERAHEALELLGSLLKRRLDATRNGDDATLEEEMIDVRQYCALEKLRLGSRLEVVEALDPATPECLLPRFTLQPLVENAIRHGIAPGAGRCTLRVTSSRNGTSWTLAIEDDGVGASEPAIPGNRGLGLSVARERLRLRFGERAAVAVRSSPGQGWTTSLTLPIELEPMGHGGTAGNSV